MHLLTDTISVNDFGIGLLHILYHHHGYVLVIEQSVGTLQNLLIILQCSYSFSHSSPGKRQHRSRVSRISACPRCGLLYLFQTMSLGEKYLILLSLNWIDTGTWSEIRRLQIFSCPVCLKLHKSLRPIRPTLRYTLKVANFTGPITDQK